MTRMKSLAAAALVLAVWPLAACSEDAQGVDAQNKQDMEQVIRNYLLNNPEVIIEALDAYRTKQEQARQNDRDQALAHLGEALTHSPDDPVLGNPDGAVTMVEFFDYRCGYCKRVFSDVQTLVAQNDDVRVVMKEFPILGPESVYASRAAQAVWLFQKDKYEDFHVAMMQNNGSLSEDKVLSYAEDAGVDVAKLKTQMENDKVMDVLRTTAQQAEALGINGTPAFIIGDMMQPGAMSLDMMEQMIDAVRGDG